METMKETRSLSPLTKRVVPARIVEDADGVYMAKEDEQGKVYRALLERDCALYHELTADRVDKEIPFQNIQLYISSQCNLNCPVCYEGRAVFAEPSLAEIEEFLSRHKKKYIVLCGREPTMRPDLTEIIKLVSERNYAVLLTNGLKLADYRYVQSLKKAGLYCVIFSFNGFDEKIYEAMNGRKLLAIKLKALENIKKVGLRASISVTLMRGINEDQLPAIYDFCIKNNSFIPELRIRTISDVGRSPQTDQFYLSELLQLACNAAGISADAARKEGRFLREVARTFRMPYILPKLCTFRFHVVIEGDRVQSVGDGIRQIPQGSSVLRYVTIPYYMLKYYGMPLIRRVLHQMGIISAEGNSHLFCIRLKCWPNIYNIDLEEIKKCSGGYYKRDSCVSFCYSNLLHDSGKDSA